jgi:hypothetical protein
MNKQFKIWPVLRDGVIIFALQLLGGIIADSIASGTSFDQSSIPTLVILTKLCFGGVGFAISGCLAVGNRWFHLCYVGGLVFSFEMAYAGVYDRGHTIQNGILTGIVTAIFICINILIGGGISLLFKRKTLVEIPSSAGDEKFYEEVARELQEKSMVPGLWTKAFAEMGGDDAKARALYIKYRLAQLTTSANQEQSVKQAQVSKAKKQQVISAFRRYTYLTIGWILTLFGCLLFVAGMAMIYSHFYPSSPSDRDEGLVASGICIMIGACAFASFGFLAFVKAGIKFTSR